MKLNIVTVISKEDKAHSVIYKLNVFYSISSSCFTKSNYEMLKVIPNDKLLLESDAPSMFNKSIYDNETE